MAEYLVRYLVSGYKELRVTADSITDAEHLAGNVICEIDCGELEDIDSNQIGVSSVPDNDSSTEDRSEEPGKVFQN